ncbi:MAG TPA: ATP-binding protein, partial [Cyclobacteriaceae bacterium]
IIEITSGVDPNGSFIEIIDNGLGIDLNRFGDDIFKMYKRFHLHTEGKGLGLYLVKLQVSAIGGNITVKSIENEYSNFRLSFPNEETSINNKGNNLVFHDNTLHEKIAS